MKPLKIKLSSIYGKFGNNTGNDNIEKTNANIEKEKLMEIYANGIFSDDEFKNLIDTYKGDKRSV